MPSGLRRRAVRREALWGRAVSSIDEGRRDLWPGAAPSERSEPMSPAFADDAGWELVLFAVDGDRLGDAVGAEVAPAAGGAGAADRGHVRDRVAEPLAGADRVHAEPARHPGVAARAA